MPFFGSPSAFKYLSHDVDQTTALGVGGTVEQFTAKNDLKYGDYVYLDPLSGYVDKSLESSLYSAFGIGLVVGGSVTNFLASDDSTLVGTTVAAAGTIVLVLTRGVGYAANDVTSVPVYIGSQITAGITTAGRVSGENPNSYLTTNPKLVIHGAGSAVGKNTNLTPIIISGIAGTALAAATDTAALSGTVTNGKYNVFAVRTTGSTNATSAMGTEAATLATVAWPTAAAATVATWGAIIVHPTGTGNFVGGTTALDDVTVVPNAVYINIYQRKPVLGYALGLGGTAGAALKILIP